MNIPETFYIALCVTILMLGIVYWFWTQVQYLQRKVNLLDNVVYEMKTFISNLPGPAQKPGNTIEPEPESHIFQPNNDDSQDSPVPTAYNPPPESVAGDLESERLSSEIEFEPMSGSGPMETSQYEPPSEMSVPVQEKQERQKQEEEQQEHDELQPGGLASVSSETKKIAVFSDSALESPLSSMSIKELRRMAEANNIPGASELRKKDLIRALRDTVGHIIGQENTASENVLSFDDIGAPNSD